MDTQTIAIIIGVVVGATIIILVIVWRIRRARKPVHPSTLVGAVGGTPGFNKVKRVRRPSQWREDTDDDSEEDEDDEELDDEGKPRYLYEVPVASTSKISSSLIT